MANPWKVTYIVLLCTAPFVLIFSLALLVVFSGRIQTSQWHRKHGDSIHVPDYEVKVLKNWREGENTVDDSNEFKSTELLRSDAESDSKINIRKMGSEEMPVATSEKQLLDDTQLVMRQMNKQNPDTVTLVKLDKGEVKLYCFRELKDGPLHLTCRTPNSPYLFLYYGKPDYEKEAREILSTLQPMG